MTMDIPIQSAVRLYVVHVRSSGPVGARSSLYRLDALTSAFMRASSASSRTPRSRNSSLSKASPFSLPARCPIYGLDREPVQRAHRELEVLLRRILVLGVAQTPQALDEEHDRRHVRGHRGGVVQRAAGEPVRLPGHLVHGLLGQAEELVVEEDGLYAPEPLPLDRDALFLGDPLGGSLRHVEHVGEHGRVERPLVQGHLAPAVERRDYGGRDVDEACRGAHVVAPGGVVSELYGGPRRRYERVSPHIHRRRAGVGVLACEANGVTLDPEGAEHHPQWVVQALEDGALLDVQLEVGRGVLELLVRLVDRVEVHLVLPQGVGERYAVPIFEVANLVGLEGAGRGAGAEEAPPEAGPLLVRPVHEAQGYGALLRGEYPQDLERPHDVQGAVEPAALGDGVYVPAEEDCPPGVAGRRGPDVPRLVALDLDAVYLLELAPEPLARLYPLVGPGHPAGAVRAACEVGELPELVHGAAGVHVLGLHQPTLSRAPISASASSKTSAASPAASRVMVSGGEMRIAFALMPPLPTRTPRSRHAWRKRTAAGGFGSPSGPTISRASIKPRPRTSPTPGFSCAIFTRRSFR